MERKTHRTTDGSPDRQRLENTVRPGPCGLPARRTDPRRHLPGAVGPGLRRPIPLRHRRLRPPGRVARGRGAPASGLPGAPLCTIPPPAGSSATDLADHYISEFLAIFDELGVGAEIYRTRDLYRSGRFNEAIDAILKNADTVRKVYAEVSKAIRPAAWLPFQIICEGCGKIGTTEVTDYDGKEVTYECKPALVTWATGCGHRGRVAPFDGNGKLPWKLEWVAKWHTLGVTIEGAGKDHCTRGGSREVAVACFRAIFGAKPPLNVPYEFFLVGGAKMSSSKSVGTSARDMADLLPPEILRFLMIRTPPKKTVNFSTDQDYLVKLYNEHDRLVESHASGRATAEQQKTLQMIQVAPTPRPTTR